MAGAIARAYCPYCRNESISMSSSELAYNRRDYHVEAAHPDKDLPPNPYRED